jgi:hypothetical protein
MASGKPLLEFSLKMITFTHTLGPAGSILIQVNSEGTGTGFAAVFDTSTFVGGGKDGTYTTVGAAYLDNGEISNSVGQGSYESKGKHRWSTMSTIQLSDGRRLGTVGEIDLAARTWKGTLSELS